MTRRQRRATMPHVTVPNSSASADTRWPAGWWRPALTAAERSGGDASAPSWAEQVANSYVNDRHRAVPVGADSWREDVARLVSPLVDDAVRRLGAALAGVPDHAVDRVALTADRAAELSRRLVSIATPVLVLELHRSRDRGLLAGQDRRARFVDFVRRHAEPGGMTDLFARYPVLARLLAQECATVVDTTAELVARFARDRDRLAALVGGARPAVTGLRPERGDRHGGGRATSVVTLSDGTQLVYKPRGVAAHLWFTRLVSAANEVVPWLGLDTTDAVAGADGCGWTAFVAPAPLSGPAAASTYFRRLGGLLALLHLARATDMHHQNLIACGDQPVLVDVETLFQPGVDAAGQEPAAAALAESVARTGLLPALAGRHGLTDISGVGGDPGQPTAAVTESWVAEGTDEMRPVRRAAQVKGAANRPVLAGRPVEAAEHAAAVQAGFGAVYDAICLHRTEFAELLRAAATVPVRVVSRPTRDYTALLARATAPDLLGDMRDRERALRSAGLSEPEVDDLLRGDIPLCTTTPDATTRFDSPGLDAALTALASATEFDRRDQQWVIAAALATRRAHPGPRAGATASAPTAVGSDELLSAACALGDRVMSAMLGGDRVNWLGLEPVTDRQWLVLPMGAGLAHGYTGVALFLAQLSRSSGVNRYGEAARRALAPVPDLLAGLRGQPESVAAVGPGGFHGFAGIGYALARLSTLLGDTAVAEWARATVPLAAEAAESNPSQGWAGGLAGCTAAMRSVATEIDCPAARALAEQCARGLRCADAAGPPDWCPDWTGDARPRSPEEMLAAATEQPVLRDLTLCHGELGHADLLAALGPSLGYDRVTPVLRRRAGMILAVLRQDGPRCATPDGVPTPGLLTGLSGIGYGLLRLGLPDRVPSALLLEPTGELGRDHVTTPQR